MFISIIDELLKEKGVTVAKMLEECKIGKNQYTYWKKNGNVPSGAILQKLADYFGVSVDYLLGKTEEKEKSPSVSDEDLKFALFGGDKDIPDEVLDEVKRFAVYAKERYGKK